MTNNKIIAELKKKAQQVRIAIIKMLGEAGSGHPGGSLSATDICTALFFHEMKHDPSNPSWDERDRFILSKGHAAPLLYVLLAKSGYFDESHLATLRKYKSILQGHPASYLTPGVEISTGSLGQGLSIAVGIALAGKMDKKDFQVFTLLGDGELDEGQIWEAAMFASHKKLDNLCAIVDRNFLQIDGNTEKVMSLEPLKDKWESFGWKVVEIDGHDFSEILGAFENFKNNYKRPFLIIAKTVKGKGVSFMENKAEWHGKPIKGELLKNALSELRMKGKNEHE
ncbi:MAG: transketolase [Candidatus Cloacimonadota bacterium]|nr:transketolase [Candidatus Cloacimonadota bacterium]